MREGLPPRHSSRPTMTQARPIAATSRDGFDTIPASESQSNSAGTQNSTSTRSQRFLAAFLAAFRADRPDTDAIHNAAQGMYGPQEQQAAAAARHSRSQRRSRRRRARQNNDQLRRTESGRSILTVPEYKTEVAEGEVMLYKAADESAVYSMDALTADISGQQTDGISDQSDDIEDHNEVQASTAPQSIAASLRNSLRRSLNRGSVSRTSRASSRRSAPACGDDNDESHRARNVDPQQARSETVELGPMEELSEEEAAAEARRSMNQLPSAHIGVTIPEDEAPNYDTLFPATTTDSTVSRPLSMASNETNSAQSRRGLAALFRTHRSSRSSPNASPFPALTPTTTNLSLQPPPSVSSVGNGHQHRRFNSSASVFSSLTGHSSPSDLATTRNGTSVDTSLFRWSRHSSNAIHPLESEASEGPRLNGRPISQPLRSTLVHMTSSQQLNERQMRFMGSVESLGRYGIPYDGGASLANSSTRTSMDLAAGRRPSFAPSATSASLSCGVQAPPEYDASGHFSRMTRLPPLLLANEVAQRAGAVKTGVSASIPSLQIASEADNSPAATTSSTDGPSSSATTLSTEEALSSESPNSHA